MTTPTVGDLCRLTVHAPGAQFEIAVPTDAPLADLLPTLVHYAGGGLPDSGLDHEGWVLQRLGSGPLDEDAGTAALGLHDGDVVHLRPRAAQLPPIHFDDLVDGVATGIRARVDAWTPRATQRLLLGLLLGCLAAGCAVLNLGGEAWLRAAVGGAVAVVLLLAAAASSRAFDDAPAAVVLGVAAIGYAVAAGFQVPGVSSTPPGGNPHLAADRLLSAGAAGTGAACLALLLAAVAVPLFAACAVAGGLVTGGGVVGVLGGVTLVQAAAVVAAPTVLAAGLVPLVAFRWAGLRLPQLPTGVDDLQEYSDPEPSADVLARTAVADRSMTALCWALGSVLAGCVSVLATASGWAPQTLAGAVCAILLLHARNVVGARQRLASVIPGALGLGLLAISHTWHDDSTSGMLSSLVVLLVAAALLLPAARLLPGRRMLPYWGRIGDLLHSLAALSAVPLVLAVLDVYHYARSLNG